MRDGTKFKSNLRNEFTSGLVHLILHRDLDTFANMISNFFYSASVHLNLIISQTYRHQLDDLCRYRRLQNAARWTCAWPFHPEIQDETVKSGRHYLQAMSLLNPTFLFFFFWFTWCRCLMIWGSVFKDLEPPYPRLLYFHLCFFFLLPLIYFMQVSYNLGFSLQVPGTFLPKCIVSSSLFFLPLLIYLMQVSRPIWVLSFKLLEPPYPSYVDQILIAMPFI